MRLAQSEFAMRRQQLLSKVGAGNIAILLGANECQRNWDNLYPFRQNSDFYYLTGFPEPEAVAVFIPGRAEGEYVLFNRSSDPAMEVWTGKRAGQAGALSAYGADQAFACEELETVLPQLLGGKEKIYYTLGLDAEFDAALFDWVNTIRSDRRSGSSAPDEFVNLQKTVHESRLFKSPDEIAIMRRASTISAGAHVRAMRACQPGLFEYQIEAELVHEFKSQGAREMAYPAVVAGGENACILHYIENNAQLREGDLLLIDAGCELDCYASDITRTFPINGRFSGEQKALYELVLNIQETIIGLCRPGMRWDEAQKTTVRMVTEGLVDLGILQGRVDDLLEAKAYSPFYMHSVGHQLGLDTHDVGELKIDDTWRRLEAGMVKTVEPGIYIRGDNPDVDEKWWNIGIRIEDDLAVTDSGCEVLSDGVPKSVADIEALCRG